MPVEFNFYNLGSATTQALNSTAAQTVLREYQPQSAEWDEERGDYVPVIEEPALVRCSTYTQSRTLVTTLNRWFAYARAREASLSRHAGIYAQYRPDTGETLYRSPVYGGFAKLENNWGPPEVRISFQHAGWWERDAEITVPWASGSNPQSFSDDPAGTNVVALTAANIEGDLKAPVRFEVANNYNNGTFAQDLHIGALLGSSGSWNGVLQCESATNSGIQSPGSNTSSGSASGGSYHTTTVYSITGGWFAALPDDPLFTTRLGWALSTSQLNTLNGRAVKPLLRFFTAPTSTSAIEIAFGVGYGAGGYGDVILARTDWINAYSASPGNALVEGPALHIPPVNVQLGGSENVAGYTFLVFARKTTASDSSMAVDYVQLFPADGYNHWIPATGGQAYQEVATQAPDWQTASILASNGTSRRAGYLIPQPPIEIISGESARFYFLHAAPTNTPIARTFQVSGFYRPRRLTI